MRAKCVLPFDFSGDIKLKMDDGVSSICGHWSQISYFSLHDVSLYSLIQPLLLRRMPHSPRGLAIGELLGRREGRRRRRGGELCMPSLSPSLTG